MPSTPTAAELLNENLRAQMDVRHKLEALRQRVADPVDDKTVDSTEQQAGYKGSQHYSLLLDELKLLVDEEPKLRKAVNASTPYSVSVPFAMGVNEIGKDLTEYAKGDEGA